MQIDERAGLLWALTGFCTLAVGDAIIKSMAGEWPATAMAFVRYVVGTLLLAGLLVRSEGWSALALPKDKLHWLRGVAISITATTMFMAVWIMPLAEAITIAFTQPIWTAILGVVFLKERSRASTWIATLIAFIGVVLVLRPNFQTVGLGAILPLVSAFCFAVAIIANKAVHGRGSILSMQYYISVTAMIFLAFVVVGGHASGVPDFALSWPHWNVWALCILIGFTACFAGWCIYMGTARAGAGTIAPMVYGQLLMATALGVFLFEEYPDRLSLLGAAIIIGSGLYLWSDTRKRALKAKAATS